MLLKGKIPVKYVLGKIKYEIVLISLYTFTIWYLSKEYNIHELSIPLGVPTILGTVLSLLLAFRSNQAYDRWWEARIIWGSIVNDSRTLTRQLLCFVQTGYNDPEKKHFIDRFVNRQIAWCYSLGKSLRGLDPLEGSGRLLTKKEITFVKNHDSVPYALLNLHAKDLKLALEEGWINEFQQVELDDTLSRLCDAMGKCERIKNTVFPMTYSLYIHFALYFFILLLPFGVIEFVGAIEIPLVTILASFFLLIERMAVHLQDPFENRPTDTPMMSISRGIERNLRQMINDEAVPERMQAEKYYLM